MSKLVHQEDISSHDLLTAVMAAVAGVESRDYSGSYIDLDEGMREDPRSNYLTAAEATYQSTPGWDIDGVRHAVQQPTVRLRLRPREARTQAAAAQIDHRGWCGRSAAAAAATGDEDLRLRECAGSCVNRGVHDAEVSAHALCTLAQGCATGLGRRKRVVRVGYGVVCGG
eukprot:CAMPEP_0181258520 /NCGR_PEP_ID=MMETSP1096-20121128/50821_1 /TAXON_ID=156174 ORGANISM="Chrysochromulina ericina, Strain CCMP281" /NCGR_SAMPLE_ID=MMETSP1096 /ASSEMBLY_ACC=CAM_ASM_000453 /LENGTH=169 /DNA_ID=CAMNT_0023356909 /DNA_START=388 /DNA_END=900 /DNA_ORIENTATION=-